MHKYYILIFVAFIFISCTISAPKGKRSWSKKPMFASLMIDDVQYTLSSTDNKYSLNNPVLFKLEMTNTSKVRKDFVTEGNKFLTCTIKSSKHKKLKKVVIKSSDVISRENFSILPNEERTFDLSIELDNEILLNNESLLNQVNLYFLKRQFRRNTLTIYLERD